MNKQFIKWLRHNQVSKDRKWVYTLIAWILENKDKKKEHINRHINTILLHNQGYFEEYRKNKEKDYWKKYYKKHNKEIMKDSSFNKKRMKAIYHLYTHGSLSEESTKTIKKQLEKLRR